MKRIAILTSGGDAPGMNAAIRAATRTAIGSGAEMVGVRRGYAGLLSGDFEPLSARDVGGILESGGTMLESARSLEFKTEEGMSRAVRHLEQAGIEGLLVVGGNGSQTGAARLSECGVPVNGIASTIDNDLAGSEITIGVDTAVNVALEAIDRLRTTASSHHRLFIVEVMGRDCGYLALTAGLAGGAEVIVTPEHPVALGAVLERIHEAHARGKKHAMVVVAEGVHGFAQELHGALCREQGGCFDPRLTTLGHVQRGGKPSAFDRLLATRLASRAASLLLDGIHGQLVGLRGGETAPTPLSEIVGRQKPLPAEMLRLADIMRL